MLLCEAILSCKCYVETIVANGHRCNNQFPVDSIFAKNASHIKKYAKHLDCSVERNFNTGITYYDSK